MTDEQYRAKAWRVILCILAAFWIVVGAIIWKVLT